MESNIHSHVNTIKKDANRNNDMPLSLTPPGVQITRAEQKKMSDFGSQDTFTHYLPVNISLPQPSPKMQSQTNGTSNAEFGAVQSNTFEGIKEQLMREIEPKIKRLIETSASQQMLNLQSELNAFAHNATMDKHGETYVHHSKKPSDVVPTAPEIRD